MDPTEDETVTVDASRDPIEVATDRLQWGLRAGMQVTPHLRLVRQVGKGGMGRVWVAFNENLESEVAVKFINARVSDPRILKRFEREARLMSAIKSPHVIQSYDHGLLENGAPFIVMELLEGETLSDRIKEQGPLPLRQLELMITQVAGVLHLAHESGLVHRDIKPHNLFLVASVYDIFVKVLDFGLAKSEQVDLTAFTTSGEMMGTPAYLSPELVDSAKDADRHADLWALAVTTYEAATGIKPFDAKTIAEMCRLIMSEQPRPASELRPELQLDAWFDKALAKDHEARFQSAREMALAFKQALAAPERPAEAPPAEEQAPITQRMTAVDHERAEAALAPARQSPARIIAIVIAISVALALAKAFL